MEKTYLSVSELAATGIADRDTILQWCHIPGQQFAFRNPGAKKWKIDMKKFERWHRVHCTRR